MIVMLIVVMWACHGSGANPVGGAQNPRDLGPVLTTQAEELAEARDFQSLCQMRELLDGRAPEMEAVVVRIDQLVSEAHLGHCSAILELGTHASRDLNDDFDQDSEADTLSDDFLPSADGSGLCDHCTLDYEDTETQNYLRQFQTDGEAEGDQTVLWYLLGIGLGTTLAFVASCLLIGIMVKKCWRKPQLGPEAPFPGLK